MAYLFIIDSIESLNQSKDSSLFLIKECLRRNIETYFCEIDQFSINKGILNVQSNKLISLNEAINYENSPPLKVNFFKKIFIRKDPPFDDEYLNLTYFLDIAVEMGVDVINNPSSIRKHNEKLSILNFKEIISPTIVTSKSHDVIDFLNEHKKVVLKPINSMGGNGIFVIAKNDQNLKSILETVTAKDKKVIMAQKYIPDITKGDKRIIIIKGNPLPYGLIRIPGNDDFRANLAKGGQGVSKKLTSQDMKIVDFIRPFLIENKLDFVGIDVIGNYLTEINVTSPTCLVEISKQTNFDCAKFIIDTI